MTQCSAHTKDGQQCRETAVDGYRVCRLHGAGSPHLGRPGGRPVVHGAYSAVVKAEEAPALEKLRALGARLEEEVAVARLQLSRALAWADEERPTRCDGKRCPYDLVDSRLSLVSRVALRCQRVADAIAGRLIEGAQLDLVVEVIERHVADEETRAAIARDLREEL